MFHDVREKSGGMTATPEPLACIPVAIVTDATSILALIPEGVNGKRNPMNWE